MVETIQHVKKNHNCSMSLVGVSRALTGTSFLIGVSPVCKSLRRPPLIFTFLRGGVHTKKFNINKKMKENSSHYSPFDDLLE